MTKKIVSILVVIAALTVIVAVGFRLNVVLEKRTYKLLYKEEIKKYAQEYDLDPFLVAAVIYCESGYSKEAVSRAGARGLMQIMPETGAWVAQKIQLAEYSDEMLYESEVNIRMGCWYLNYLSSRFAGVKQHILAAYNAGPSNVQRWMEDTQYSQNGRLVKIPFKETENYVERVMRAYEKYRELYEEELA